MTLRRTLPGLVVALALMLAAAAVGAELRRLPKDIALPMTGKKHSVVTFKHTTHVKPESADCATCHPRPWPMKRRAKQPVITHKLMDQGELCGKCHGEGKESFDLEDCDKCHASDDE